jgi:hypothetical protein
MVPPGLKNYNHYDATLEQARRRIVGGVLTEHAYHRTFMQNLARQTSPPE